MKKILTMILILFSITLMSCKKDEYIIINEVKNYEVDVEEKITISTLEDALVNAIKKAEQSVIGVIATSGSIFSGESFGSGVIIASKKISNTQQKYYVVTNRHVILNKSNKTYSQIKIYYGNMDNLIEAELLMYDETQDLALLSFVTEKIFAIAKTADSTKLEKGRYVIAIGSPYDYEYLYNTATVGNISHPNRRYEEKNMNDITCYNYYIQHDASINSGNSGGGLFNINGELIGINTWKIIGTEQYESYEGLGFSIPIHVVLQTVSSYIYQ